MPFLHVITRAPRMGTTSSQALLPHAPPSQPGTPGRGAQGSHGLHAASVALLVLKQQKMPSRVGVPMCWVLYAQRVRDTGCPLLQRVGSLNRYGQSQARYLHFTTGEQRPKCFGDLLKDTRRIHGRLVPCPRPSHHGWIC